LSTAIKLLPHYTYYDYEQWKGNWELIDGLPFAVPSKAANNQQVVANLIIGFCSALNNTCAVYQSMPYLITDDTILKPELMIVYGEKSQKFLDFPPVLVVEILFPATVLKERHKKFGLYEDQGIKYYIIIAPDKQEAEIYELLDGKYQLKQAGKNIVHEFFFPECTARVDFKEIW
jgi:Uma2 family endonuclease